MLVLLFTAFYAMTRYDVPLPLAMSLVACAFLIIQWDGAPAVLRSGFEHYADITILFTAVAIPAHMIERSQGFKWVAAWLGHELGKVRLKNPAAHHPAARRGHARRHLRHRRADAQRHVHPDHDAGHHPALRVLWHSVALAAQRGADRQQPRRLLHALGRHAEHHRIRHLGARRRRLHARGAAGEPDRARVR